MFPNVINPQVKAETTTSSVREAIFSTGTLHEQALFPTSRRGHRAWTKVFDELLRIQTRET